MAGTGDDTISMTGTHGSGGFSNDLGGGSLVLTFTSAPETKVAILNCGMGLVASLRRRRKE